MTQLVDQVKLRLISQLISNISRVFQRLLRYFNGPAISTFKIPASLVLLNNLYLNLKDLESIIVSLGASL